MVANQSWLGISLNFSNTEDKTANSGSGFELLKNGDYRCTLKVMNKSELGQNHKPALTVTFTLDDYNDKEMTTNLFLPEQTDSETAITFKKENLYNFASRFIYRNITKAEFDKIPKEDVNKAIEELFLKTQPNVAGAKMLVNIKQEPFVSRDRDTRAVKWTDKPFNANICTKPVLKVIQELQKSGVEVDKFPVILFSNKVSAYGFGFYNDYNENAELKNSPSYDFIQSLGASAVSGSETATTDIGEVSF